MSDSRAQGSLEFLLLIAGVILVVTVVLFLNTTQVIPVAESEFQDNVSTYQNQLSLNSILNSTNVSPPNSGNLPCGNLVLDVGESCDVDDQGIFLLGGASCQTLGFKSGALSCDAACLFVTSGCVPKFSGGGGGSSGGGGGGGIGGNGGGNPGPGAVCGDGSINGSEICEITGNTGCASPLVCNSCTSCDSQGGVICGDGSLDPSEVCEIIGNLGCAPNTTCVSCSQSCISDTIPPVINSFSLIQGNAQILVQYSAVDTNPPSNPLTYILLRSTMPGLLNTIVSSDFDNPPSGTVLVPIVSVNSVLDTPLQNNRSYFYRMRVCDSAPIPNCVLTNVISGTPSSSNQSDIYPPTINVFSLTSLNASVKIHFRSDDPFPPSDPIEYLVVRGTTFNSVNNLDDPFVPSGGSFDALPNNVVEVGVVSLSSNVLSFMDDFGLTNNVSYYYRVRACDNATPIRNCSYSYTFGISPHSAPDLEAPTISRFTLTPNIDQISLDFLGIDNPIPATLEYTIFRANGINAFTLLRDMTAKGNVNSFDNPPAGVTLVYGDVLPNIHVDTLLSSGTTYYYRMRICDFSLARNCVLSLTKSAIPLTDSSPPVVSFSAIPNDFLVAINFSATDDVSLESVHVLKTDDPTKWNLYKNNLSAYQNPPDGMVASTLFSNSGQTIQNYSNVLQDEGVRNGVNYYYGISACDTSNNCSFTFLSPEYVAPVGPIISVSLGNSVETIFRGDDDSPYPNGSNNCIQPGRDPIQDAPDYPMRAFKNNAGETIVYMGAGDNYIWVLDNHDWSATNFLEPGTRQCSQPSLIWRRDYLQPPSAYIPYPYWDKQWLSSPYTLDGQTVYALVHDEYQEGYNNGNHPCWDIPGTTCTLMSDTWVVSTDGGHTFSDASYSPLGQNGAGYPTEEPQHIISAIPRAYETPYDVYGNPTPYGSIQPTNIIREASGNPSYYSIFGTVFQGGLWSQSGHCLGRTTDLSDPTSWEFFQWKKTPFSNVRGTITEAAGNNTFPNLPTRSGLFIGPRSSWNLDSFFTSKTYPIVLDSSNNDSSRDCGFVSKYPGNVWPIGSTSLTYNTYLQKYLLVFPMAPVLDCGFYFSVSPDLIHWSEPQLLRDHSAYGYAANCSQNTTHYVPNYPSLIDRDNGGLSNEWNYEFTNETADIYWSGRRVGFDHFADLDVLRQSVTFSCPQGC